MNSKYIWHQNFSNDGFNNRSKKFGQKKRKIVYLLKKLWVKIKAFFMRFVPKTKKGKEKFWKVLATLSSLALFGILSGTVILFIVLGIFARSLPNPNRLLERSEELSTKIMDRNGESIYEVFGEKHRILIKPDEVTDDLINATLAVEDSNFYTHQGVDIRGVLRAVKNTLTGKGLQGGSTLSQQVVKNAVLSQERTITRKLKELVLTWQIENTYSKNEILQMYLNETPYGGQNYGIFTVARAYFNKHPSELTTAESAYLAGLPQSPSRYSPYSSDPNRGLERKNYVLYLMNERGWLDEEGERYYLSDEDYKAALNEKLDFTASPDLFRAPHFMFYVKEILVDMYGEDLIEQRGLQVTTTLDLELQESFQEIVKEEVDNAQPFNINNGALVATDPQTGQILSMVGSKDYFADSSPEGCSSGITGKGSCTFEPQLNVSLAKRQPGSSIKPITYATMLSQGYTASTRLLDVPTVFVGADAGEDYEPVNYDGEYRGPMSLRKSLGNSINVPAVKALAVIGVDSMVKQAEKMGISTFNKPERYGLSLTLGGGETKLLEMTNAFGVFASGGLYRESTPILEVKDAKGNILYSYRDSGGERVLSEGVAFLISDILSDDGARSEVFGFGSSLNIRGEQVAVKTGTTDDKRDNYAIGFTKDIVIGTWVGNNNNDEMYAVASGISGATPIWRRAMLEAIADKDPNNFEAPDNVEKFDIDELTGMLPYGDNDTRKEWFILGTEPTSVSDWYKELEICKEDGKIANDECKDADETETKDFVDITALRSEWQIDIDEWLEENYEDEDRFFPPQMKSALEFDGDDVEDDKDPKVEIVNWDNGDKAPQRFRLKVEVSSANDIDEVRIYRDGERVTEDDSFPYGYNFKFEDDQLGTHEFKAVAEDEDGRKDETTIKLKIVQFSY